MLTVGVSMLSLARVQFAMTTVFHFFFVPFSIGMAFITAIMETIYVVKKAPIYKQMAQFWGKIFLLSFAVGVVTGLIQEFQFGMNWSDYSRFMGDIFGAPLAIEALLAFFLESVFIGLWMFTWDRFKPAIHVIFIWLVMLGSSASALWILTANSFMQNPVAYKLANGRAEMTSFTGLLKNPQLWVEFPHVVFGAFLTAAMAVAGMSAWRLLKHKNIDFYKKSLKIGLIVGLIFSLGTIYVGDAQTRMIIKDQPMKFAATEGLYDNTGKKAPWAMIEGINAAGHKATWKVEIPDMLSIMSYHKTTGAVKGMNTINRELHQKYDKKFGKDMNYYVPPKTLFWSFRVMAGFGTLFALVTIVGLWFMRKKNNAIENKRWFLYVLGICLWLPFLANTAGWFVTELGRYPWIVYGLFTIADAVSPSVTAGELLFSNITYFLIFTMLGGTMIYFSHKTLVAGPELDDGSENRVNVDPFAKGAFNHE
ncbi:cytochrome ubiquinol oxidase subunit I [Loigolactobacillus backii]|uniref:Cytochrome D ubiquinol oxidase subunit I n=1 Tax=Loigolactobacillus backii TaxID=375175 RepID=A0A192GXP3_9LACO|nr:cytochrome D ubiquinol oxidase subunit I [Loigolactobacillus backii]ANK61284.1 cytochrome D ubiquinol oxidase subunit I [Loigolactobacillus backii]ANK64037.1 cytochrome D ubiquinol oxidase subunit I [Loigolactobacillus backii]ANK66485.1 cytochrome D ubiquinol oxidase subunit I [Loigolactobacillus backii]ANK69516.1 cytochrome D ubiquinol oxidase subunit I [Loigolactobacillus backii]